MTAFCQDGPLTLHLTNGTMLIVTTFCFCSLVVLAGLELVAIALPLSPQCWDTGVCCHAQLKFFFLAVYRHGCGHFKVKAVE